jgi:hypothetical protein
VTPRSKLHGFLALLILACSAVACGDEQEQVACGVLVDSTSYADAVPIDTWIADLRPYLYKQSCGSVSYAVVTANASATACRGTTVRIDPEGQMEGPERDEFRNRQLVRAVEEARKILACGENETATHGYSDVVGALRSLAEQQDDEGRPPVRIVAFSDFGHRTQTPPTDLYRAPIVTPPARKQIIDRLRNQGMLPQLAPGTEILIQRFGAFIDPKDTERANAFKNFWTELFAAAGNPQVKYD